MITVLRCTALHIFPEDCKILTVSNISTSSGRDLSILTAQYKDYYSTTTRFFRFFDPERQFSYSPTTADIVIHKQSGLAMILMSNMLKAIAFKYRPSRDAEINLGLLL